MTNSTKDDLQQYKMLSVQEEPLSSSQRHLDTMCFPILFPDGNFGKYHPRKVPVSHSEYDKSRLWNKDSRFRKDPQYVFYLLKEKESRELKAGVYNLLKTSKSTPTTVTNILQKVTASDQKLEANLSTMFQSIRGTKQYWYRRRGELMCMLRELGPQSLFLTFSCAEYESPDIAEYLRLVNNVPDKYSINKLCTEDPVSVSRQFSHKFHAFFNTFIVKGEVLGPVEHFYWKKEYQARGAPHYHAVLWIKGAPIIGQDDPDVVLSWIQERITCHIPDKENNPGLHHMVTRYQLHKCSNYCRKKRKRGSLFLTSCKFGFPRPERETAVINNVDSSCKNYQKIYEIPRAPSEVRVNDYNPLLLLNWGANMDIQFVGDRDMVLSTYVSGYVTKYEHGHLQEQYEGITDDKSLCSKLFSIGRMFLKSRECGMHEAADHLSGDHLYEKSVTIQWVDVRMPHKRQRRVKTHAQLLKMESDDPESENIFTHNFLSTYYPQRPDDLEDICLHDFVANYSWHETDHKGDRIYRKLSKPRLVNHKMFDPAKPENREDYYYSLILLFVPFRDEGALLRENETAEEAFNRLLPHSDDCSNYHRKLQTMLNAEAKVRKINEARKAEITKNKENKEQDNMHILGEAKHAMKDIQDMNQKMPDSLTLQQREEMFNADQKRVYDNIRNTLIHQKQHEEGQSLSDYKPFTMFVSGVGGTGKSFLIEAVKALVDSLWTSEGLKCAITAPTGLAAFNVGGVTIHRLFQLPIEHEGKEAGYWSLSKDAQKVMKTTLRSLKLLVIDEVSMVSSLNLTYVHMRMQEIFGEDHWFGGKNVLFVGDLLQLQPVNGNPVFEKMSRAAIVHKLGCIGLINIWKDCVHYDELTINERQKKDGRFCDILGKVRCGTLTEEILTVLKQHVIHVPVVQKLVKLSELGENPVCLFPTRKQCDLLNEEMLGKLQSQVHVIPCIDDVDETRSTAKWHQKAAKQLEKMNNDCNNTAGLEAVLKLALGARVMLRRNIDVKAGLVNGAIGTILGVFPERVSIKFDHLDSACDIEKVKGKFMVLKNYYVSRTQFPLILAYGVTIHKCQGLSLNCAIVDLSEKVFADGMAYVALSRVRSLNGLYLTTFDAQSIRVSKNSVAEVNRLRQLFRKDLPLYQTPTACASRKRKLTGTCDVEPQSKKRCGPTTKKHEPEPKSKSVRTEPRQKKVWPFIFHSVDEQWQRTACHSLNAIFKQKNPTFLGSGERPLTRPDMRRVKRVKGDGNCMFRALSLVVTGSEDQHHAIRTRIVQHMRSIAHLMLGHIKSHTGFNTCQNIDEYLQKSKMAECNTWGSDIELLCFAHLCKVCVFSYSTESSNWDRYGPNNVDRTITVDVTAKSIYLFHPSGHYDVVGCTLKPPNSTPDWLEQSRNTEVWNDLRFHSVDSEWQLEACNLLGLPLHGPNGVNPGGPNLALTSPASYKSIQGDGNCLFRSLSYLITGSCSHYRQVREKIIDHMRNVLDPVYVSDYLRSTNMDEDGIWGTDNEIRTLAHLLRTSVYTYVPDSYNWVRITPEEMDQDFIIPITQKAMYLENHRNHFNVVMTVKPIRNTDPIQIV